MRSAFTDESNKVNQYRRRLLKALLGATLFSLGPSRLPNGRFALFPTANAWYLQAASLALSALSSFNRSDGGLSAMLGNLKDLSEENIRLSNKILINLATLQASVDELPEHVRRVLIEHSEYKVRADTAAIVMNLDVVNRRLQEDKNALKKPDVRKYLEECISAGSQLAGVQSVPYGIGPVGAFCAPIVAGAVSKAHTLLGQHASVRAEIAAKYLPWIARISDQNAKGSLVSLIYEEGNFIKEFEARLIERLPPRLQIRLKEHLSNIINLQSGQKTNHLPVSCVKYVHVDSYRKQCEKMYCDPDASRLDYPKSTKRTSEWILASRGEDGLLTLPDDREILLRGCSCSEWKNVPVWKDGAAVVLKIEVENSYSPKEGPALNTAYTWADAVSAEDMVMGCDEGSRGQALAVEEERKNAAKSQAAKDWEQEIEKLKEDGLSVLVAHRQVLWTYYSLLENSRESQRRIQKIFNL